MSRLAPTGSPDPSLTLGVTWTRRDGNGLVASIPGRRCLLAKAGRLRGSQCAAIHRASRHRVLVDALFDVGSGAARSDAKSESDQAAIELSAEFLALLSCLLE